MRVFEVKSDSFEEDGTITEQIQYVAGDSVEKTAIYFANECEQLGYALKSVREVIIVAQDIRGKVKAGD